MQQFDLNKKTLVQQYAECRVECAFKPLANRLHLQITLTNNTSDVIRRCEFLPLVLRLPHTVRNAVRWDRGTFLADVYDHEKGTVIVTPTGRFTYGSRDGLYAASLWRWCTATTVPPISTPGSNYSRNSARRLVLK